MSRPAFVYIRVTHFNYCADNISCKQLLLLHDFDLCNARDLMAYTSETFFIQTSLKKKIIAYCTSRRINQMI